MLVEIDGRDAWSLAAGAMAWTVEVAGLHHSIYAHPDSETFLYAAATGEVGRLRIDTGAEVSRTSIHIGLRGARFSRSCGLEPELLDAMALAGAIVID